MPPTTTADRAAIPDWGAPDDQLTQAERDQRLQRPALTPDQIRHLIATHCGSIDRMTRLRDDIADSDPMRAICTHKIREVEGWIASLELHLPAQQPVRRDPGACTYCAAAGGRPCAPACRSRFDDHELAD